MKIKYLKTQLSVVTGSTVKEVYFSQKYSPNTEISKEYPYVFWDLNSLKSQLNWTNTAQEKESIKIKAYCFGYLDKDAAASTTDALESMYDTIRDAFRGYLTVLNTNAYIQVTNLSSMANELFPFGLSVDSEVAVSFDVEMDLFCNVS